MIKNILQLRANYFFLCHHSRKIFILIVLLSCMPVFALSSNQITDAQWQQDISIYLEELEQRHINLFHTTSQKSFYNKIKALRKQVSNLSDNEILFRLMEITRMIGDGHTSFALWGKRLHKFPIRLIAINQRIFVNAATHENRYLLKSELVAINGRPITEIFESLAKRVPFSENAYSTQVRIAQYIPIAEVLNGAGFIDSDYLANFTFKKNGKIIQKNWLAKVSHNIEKAPTLGSLNSHDKVASVNESLWFSSSSDKRSVYVKFERYTDHDSMEGFAAKLLRFINKNQSENLIIDLRNNYGGDFFTGLKLAQYLVLADSLNWQSGNYVLINNVTFSAAMSNASQFKNILNATLVGEPTGAKPKGYQDMGEFTLPHSKRIVTYSKRFYSFMGNNEEALYPDKLINLTVEDYTKGVDKQLEWVLSQVGWYF